MLLTGVVALLALLAGPPARPARPALPAGGWFVHYGAERSEEVWLHCNEGAREGVCRMSRTIVTRAKDGTCLVRTREQDAPFDFKAAVGWTWTRTIAGVFCSNWLDVWALTKNDHGEWMLSYRSVQTRPASNANEERCVAAEPLEYAWAFGANPGAEMNCTRIEFGGH